MRKKRSVFSSIIVCSISLLVLQPSPALAGNSRTKIATTHLTQYAQAYPDIYFLHLRAEDMWALNALPDLIGRDATNLDYEHDLSTSKSLMAVQLARIRMLLSAGAPSATLFATGNDAVVTQPYVCILTLEDRKLLQNSMSATAFMLKETRQNEIRNLAPAAIIDIETFLGFTLDHEIYHCLDAYLHGPPRPRTHNQLTAWYYDFLVEYRADMFASLRIRSNDRKSDLFLKKMTTYRNLSLDNFDFTHLTAGAIETVLTKPGGCLSSLPLAGLAQLADTYANNNLPTKDEYLRVLAAAFHVARLAGMAEDEDFEQGNTPDMPAARPKDIVILTRALLQARKNVFGSFSPH